MSDPVYSTIDSIPAMVLMLTQLVGERTCPFLATTRPSPPQGPAYPEAGRNHQLTQVLHLDPPKDLESGLRCYPLLGCALVRPSCLWEALVKLAPLGVRSNPMVNELGVVGMHIQVHPQVVVAGLPQMLMMPELCTPHLAPVMVCCLPAPAPHPSQISRHSVRWRSIGSWAPWMATTNVAEMFSPVMSSHCIEIQCL